MIDGFVAGKLYGTVMSRTGQNGKTFVTAKVRASVNEGEALFVNVIAFADAAKDALLALDEGDAVSLVGKLTPRAWADEKGGARPALDLVADAVLTVYHVRRKREAVVAKVVTGSTSVGGAEQTSLAYSDVHQLPFRSVEEAKENAALLRRAFRFCSLRHVSDDGDFPSPERTQDVMAQAMGCLDWSDLVSSVEEGTSAPYFDSVPTGADHRTTPACNAAQMHRALTTALLPLLEYVDDGAKSQMASRYRTYERKEHRIQAALKYSALGCSPTMRQKAEAGLARMPYDTVDQWCRFEMFQRGHNNATRYARGWSEDHRKSFEWHDERERGLIQGRSIPQKPREGSRVPV